MSQQPLSATSCTPANAHQLDEPLLQGAPQNAAFVVIVSEVFGCFDVGYVYIFRLIPYVMYFLFYG